MLKKKKKDFFLTAVRSHCGIFKKGIVSPNFWLNNLPWHLCRKWCAMLSREEKEDQIEIYVKRLLDWFRVAI